MSEIVTSLQNQRVKEAVKLRDRRGRDKQRRIIIDGVREISRAMDADIACVEAFACEALLGDQATDLVARLDSRGVEVIRVTEQVFAKVAFGDRHEGVVVVANTPMVSLQQLALPASPSVAVLEGIEKPGNVGAILRTADAAGISAVLLADPRTDLFNPNVIRASQGAVFGLPVAAAKTDEVLAWLRGRGFRILATRVDAQGDYADASYEPPCAIVLGSEAEGLTDAWRGDDVNGIRLPMRGEVDSLNVSVTAGVLFYEALRQREASGG